MIYSHSGACLPDHLYPPYEACFLKHPSHDFKDTLIPSEIIDSASTFTMAASLSKTNHH